LFGKTSPVIRISHGYLSFASFPVAAKTMQIFSQSPVISNQLPEAYPFPTVLSSNIGKYVKMEK